MEHPGRQVRRLHDVYLNRFEPPHPGCLQREAPSVLERTRPRPVVFPRGAAEQQDQRGLLRRRSIVVVVAGDKND